MKTYLENSLFPSLTSSSTILERSIGYIILLSVFVLVLETEPTLSEPFQRYFAQAEIIFLMIFSGEYIARLLLAGVRPEYQGLKGRLKYMISPFALIDLIAILPSLLAGLLPDLMLIRLVRLVRMMRIAKLIKSNRALTAFFIACRTSGSQLAASLMATLLMLFVGAVLLYVAESEAQPEAFGSIPRAMWWSMATLTTVGYGDTYPVTVLGKLLASMVAILGISVVALPAGIIAANFSKQLENMKSDEQ
jgi:voltage-gated potassium channel